MGLLLLILHLHIRNNATLAGWGDDNGFEVHSVFGWHYNIQRYGVVHICFAGRIAIEGVVNLCAFYRAGKHYFKFRTCEGCIHSACSGRHTVVDALGIKAGQVVRYTIL